MVDNHLDPEGEAKEKRVGI